MKFYAHRSLFLGLLHLVLFFGTALVVVPADAFEVFASNNPPFNYQDADGVAQGIAVDVLEEIMKQAGVSIDPANVLFINWARAMYETSFQSGRILLSPARTPKREDQFKWVGPLHSFKLGLVARKDKKITIQSVDELKQYNVGVIRGSAPAQLLQKQYGLIEKDMTFIADDEQLFLMLERGRVDLVPRGAASSVFWLNRLELNPDDFEMVYVLKELELYIAFSPSTDPDFIDRLNGELQILKTSRADGSNAYQAIVNRHLLSSSLEIR